MRFTKMHGTGNDYVYINGSEEPVSDPASLARRVSDRHKGVGSDGLVLILPSQRADIRMRMFNADGSEAEMCGNAIRCVAKYAFEQELVCQETIRVETKSGVRDVHLRVIDGRVRSATVDMGQPEWRPELIPVQVKDGWACGLPLMIDGEKYTVNCVSMGNPHAIVFTDDVDTVPLERIGPLIERHPLFPMRTNVEFVQKVSGKEIRMRVWERGAGETQACGTGACAAVAVAARLGKTARAARVLLAGGYLDIDWRENGNVFMTGEAVRVYEGVLDESE